MTSGTGDNQGTPGGSDDRYVGAVVGGRYRVVRELGQGGMGAVYEAVHVDIEKPVALKVLHPSFADDPVLRERFLREAKAAARIGHPNVVDITDFGATEDGVVFIVMELLEGQDLGQLLRSSGALPWSHARDVLRQVCDALAAAHARGIIHRDIKPENVFIALRPDGAADRVKVVDFGIAKLLHERNQPKLTAVGMVHGTPGFIAPEQISGGTVDHRADVYAVGALAYRMVAGIPPFPGDNVLQVLTRQMNETPVPPSQVVPTVPAELDGVLERAMAREAAQRIDSMEALAAAFLSIPCDEDEIETPPPMDPPAAGTAEPSFTPEPVRPRQPAPVVGGVPRERGRGGLATVLLGLTILAVAGGVVWALLRKGGETPAPAVSAVPAGQPEDAGARGMPGPDTAGPLRDAAPLPRPDNARPPVPNRQTARGAQPVQRPPRRRAPDARPAPPRPTPDARPAPPRPTPDARPAPPRPTPDARRPRRKQAPFRQRDEDLLDPFAETR